jgi:hypothetical protein
MAVHIWSELGEVVLGPEEVSRSFQQAEEGWDRVRSFTLYLPAMRRFAASIQLSEIVTAQDAAHLEGYRIISFGAYGKLLEISRQDGRISSSQELPRNISAVEHVVSQFFDAIDRAVSDYVTWRPEDFSESPPSILYTPELLRSLLIQSMTSTQRPSLIPRVHVPLASVKLLASELEPRLPWIKEGYGGSIALHKEAAGYRFIEHGERGGVVEDKTFTGLDAAAHHLFSRLMPLELNLQRGWYGFNPAVIRRSV